MNILYTKLIGQHCALYEYCLVIEMSRNKSTISIKSEKKLDNQLIDQRYEAMKTFIHWYDNTAIYWSLKEHEQSRRFKWGNQSCVHSCHEKREQRPVMRLPTDTCEPLQIAIATQLYRNKNIHAQCISPRISQKAPFIIRQVSGSLLLFHVFGINT